MSIEGPTQALASADNCTKCGICQSHCPVLAATPEFPGPKYAGPQAARFRSIAPVIDRSTDLCTGCGICTSVCPNDVRISDIITIARADGIARGSPVPLGQRLLNRPDAIGKLSALSPALANRVLASPIARRLGEALLGIHRDAPLPRIHG